MLDAFNARLLASLRLQEEREDAKRKCDLVAKHESKKPDIRSLDADKREVRLRDAFRTEKVFRIERTVRKTVLDNSTRWKEWDVCRESELDVSIGKFAKAFPRETFRVSEVPFGTKKQEPDTAGHFFRKSGHKPGYTYTNTLNGPIRSRTLGF